MNGIIKIRNRGKIIIGNNLLANSGSFANPIGGDTILRIITYSDALVEIGDNVGISNSTIVCANHIKIENGVYIGGSTRIWDTNFHSVNPLNRLQKIDDDIKTSPILIKKNAFIGGGCIILKGVTIGENSIVAAGSVVVKDIPDNVIAGGNPCKIIQNLNFAKE